MRQKKFKCNNCEKCGKMTCSFIVSDYDDDELELDLLDPVVCVYNGIKVDWKEIKDEQNATS